MTRTSEKMKLKPGPIWELHLFVAHAGPLTDRAVENLNELCRVYLPGRFQIDLVDIEADPEQADLFDVIATPTLVRVKPAPVRRVIGDLSRADGVVAGLNLPGNAEPRDAKG